MYSESFITSFRGKKLLAPSRTSNFKILFIHTDETVGRIPPFAACSRAAASLAALASAAAFGTAPRGRRLFP